LTYRPPIAPASVAPSGVDTAVSAAGAPAAKSDGLASQAGAAFGLDGDPRTCTGPSARSGVDAAGSAGAVFAQPQSFGRAAVRLPGVDQGLLVSRGDPRAVRRASAAKSSGLGLRTPAAVGLDGALPLSASRTYLPITAAGRGPVTRRARSVSCASPQPQRGGGLDRAKALRYPAAQNISAQDPVAQHLVAQTASASVTNFNTASASTAMSSIS
jgi:hypothetical protein